MSSIKLSKLGNFIEKVSIKAAAFENYEKLQVFGVSNIEGITITSHNKSKDISKYQFIDEGCFAYNPYRINVGSIGLTPKKQKGLVSPAYVVFRTKPEKLIPEMLLDFLKSDEGLFQINKYARGTVRKALRYDDLCKIEIPDIPIEKQITGQKKKKAVRRNLLPLQNEITHQQTLLKKLHQSILQDAISGKLTKKWRKENPDTEPASELLKRIKEEKERMVQEKKIKKQKPLPPITEGEIPFELPKGWIWCRLGEVAVHNLGKMLDQIKNKGEHQPYLRNLNVRWEKFDLEDLLEMRFEKHEVHKYEVKYGDVLICEGGEPGRAAIWRNEISNMKIQKAIHRVRFFDGVTPVFFMFYIQWAARSKYLNGYFTGAGIKHLTGKNLGLLLLPLAPIQEQKIINDKIERVKQTCENLEFQINKSKLDSDFLMQAVLKEVFEG